LTVELIGRGLPVGHAVTNVSLLARAAVTFSTTAVADRGHVPRQVQRRGAPGTDALAQRTGRHHRQEPRPGARRVVPGQIGDEVCAPRLVEQIENTVRPDDDRHQVRPRLTCPQVQIRHHRPHLPVR
jgi:hypothetical protein